MPIFRKAALIGIGLIGGSLALDLKKKRIASKVVGVSKHTKTIALARKKKAIDEGSTSLSVIKGADLVIIATPVDTIFGLKKLILKYAGKNCIVTDVASTKEDVTACLGNFFPNYIGSHPLAGSEKRGIESACGGMFKGTLCILTLENRSSIRAFNKVRKMWRSLGAKVMVMKPREHDRILSFASHLPHLVAFALINSLPSATLGFCGKGLKDTTRIAASDPILWKGIFLTNKKHLLKAAESFEKSFSKIKSAVRSNDPKALEAILSKSQKKRESLK